MTTEKTNLVAAVKIGTKDGSAAAIVTAKSLYVNNTPKVNQIKDDLWAINFPSNVVGEQKLKNLEYALNGAQLTRTEYGVSAQVTVYAHTEKQKEYFESVLTKGARLETVMARATVNDYGLRLTLVDGGVAWIEKRDGSEAIQETAKVEQKATMAEVIEAEENDCGI